MARHPVDARTPYRIAVDQANPQRRSGMAEEVLHHRLARDRESRGFPRISSRPRPPTGEVGLDACESPPTHLLAAKTEPAVIFNSPACCSHTIFLDHPLISFPLF